MDKKNLEMPTELSQHDLKNVNGGSTNVVANLVRMITTDKAREAERKAREKAEAEALNQHSEDQGAGGDSIWQQVELIEEMKRNFS